jgi:hypothetical protein
MLIWLIILSVVVVTALILSSIALYNDSSDDNIPETLGLSHGDYIAEFSVTANNDTETVPGLIYGTVFLQAKRMITSIIETTSNFTNQLIFTRGTGEVILTAPEESSTYTLTLPSTVGTEHSIQINDGEGNQTWSSLTTGGTINVEGVNSNHLKIGQIQTNVHTLEGTDVTPINDFTTYNCTTTGALTITLPKIVNIGTSYSFYNTQGWDSAQVTINVDAEDTIDGGPSSIQPVFQNNKIDIMSITNTSWFSQNYNS